MTLSSISSALSSSQLESVSNTRSSSAARSTSGLASDAPPGLSKMASLMKQLEDLQESDPTRFKEVTATIAAKLKEAAQTATENGDTRQAAALTSLADKFTQASEDGTMPDLRPPEGAGPAGGPPPGPPPADSDDSSTTDSTSATAARYKEMMALFQAASDANPMAALENILSDVFSASSAS